jgi:surface polysaccharide O-acyltransferase-like enzyme
MERNNAFDIFKGLAIIAVIAIHASSSGWSWFQNNNYEWNFYFTLIVKQLYVFAVPSFFFMAGYFLVKKGAALKVDYKVFISKKLKRVLIPYVLWSMIIMLFLHQNTNVIDVIYRLLLGKAQGTYYFVIALSLLICISPLLINSKNIKKNDFSYFFYKFTNARLDLLYAL